jgi:hypothetical protein
LARPGKAGSPARDANRRKLTDLFVTTQKGGDRDEMIWDERCLGLALSVRTTGKKARKVVYRHSGRPRWLHLADARRLSDIEPKFICTACGSTRRRRAAEVWAAEDGDRLSAAPFSGRSGVKR